LGAADPTGLMLAPSRLTPGEPSTGGYTLLIQALLAEFPEHVPFFQGSSLSRYRYRRGFSRSHRSGPQTPFPQGCAAQRCGRGRGGPEHPSAGHPHAPPAGLLGSRHGCAVATGYDPLLDTEPELARPMAASVQPRIAFGARAGEQVCRLGSGFGSAGERPARTGPRCASATAFPCMPTPRCQRSGVISWST
jgi:hypothetical protein